MKILAFFSSSGTPATGLTPTIRIRELDGNTLVVTDAAMSEVGDGHYQYDFTTYDKDIDYAIRCDGGMSLTGADRYTYAGNENYIDDIADTITENTSAGSSYTNDLILDVNLDVLAASASSKQEFSDLNTKVDSLSASNESNFTTVNNNISTVDTRIQSLSATNQANFDALSTIVNAIPGDVWDQLLADHTIAGSFGAELATKADVQAAFSTNDNLAVSGGLLEGTNVTGSYLDTFARDSVYWEIQEDAATGIIVEFVFNIPENDRAGVFQVFGRYIGTPVNSHYMDLDAYNYEAGTWENLLDEFMPGGNTTDALYQFEYFERNIDRENLNEVRIRLRHHTTTYIASHELFLDFVNLTSVDVTTAAEIAGAVWSVNPSGYFGLTNFGGLVKNTNTKIDSLSASNQANFDTVNTNIAAASGGDITSISTQIDSLSASNQANFDTVNTNISEVNTNVLGVSASIVDVSNDLKRLLGLTHENIFIDNPVYDGDCNMTSARVRIYSNPASVGTANDVIGTYTITAPSSAPGKFITWSQVRV